MNSLQLYQLNHQLFHSRDFYNLDVHFSSLAISLLPAEMAARSGTITEATVARTASHDNLYCESEEEDTSDEESRLTEVRVGSPHSFGLVVGCVNTEFDHLPNHFRSGPTN